MECVDFLFFLPTVYQHEAASEGAFYHERGFCKFSGAHKTHFREFLRKIGCRYLDSSMSLALVGDVTVTKELEKWSVPSLLVTRYP